MRVIFSSASNEWATPAALFAELDREFDFQLDPAATPENAKCPAFYTMADDGLAQPWAPRRVFLNPPYGRQLGRWISKAKAEAEQGATVVCVIPARTDTAYWHDCIFGRAEIRFIRGRVRFGDGRGNAPFPSAVVIFRPGCANSDFINVINASPADRPAAARGCAASR